MLEEAGIRTVCCKQETSGDRNRSVGVSRVRQVQVSCLFVLAEYYRRR